MNLEDLTSVIKEAFGDLVADYNEWVDAVIESPDMFSDRGFVDHDIVDTGRLLNSKEVDAKDTEATFLWEPHSPLNGFPYAPAVWTGFYAWGDKRNYIPGRHWPERAATTLNDVGVTQAFVEKLKDLGLEATIVKNGDEDIDD